MILKLNVYCYVKTFGALFVLLLLLYSTPLSRDKWLLKFVQLLFIIYISSIDYDWWKINTMTPQWISSWLLALQIVILNHLTRADENDARKSTVDRIVSSPMN